MSLPGYPVDSVAIEASTLRLESLGSGVQRIVLSRPDVRNAFDETMMSELRSALEHLTAMQDPSRVRLLLLEGEGKVFSAGADLAYMRRLAEQSEAESLTDARSLGRLFYNLADFPAPVIAYVQGAAIGGGLGLTVCADYVLAAEGAVFATSEVRLGIVPGVISPYIVRKIGLDRAAPLMLSGRRLTASEALDHGLVQRVVAAGEREDALVETVSAFLEAGPRAARRTKQLLKLASPLPGPEVLEATARHIAEARCSDEGRAGLAAFFDRSKPGWAPEAGGPGKDRGR